METKEQGRERETLNRRQGGCVCRLGLGRKFVSAEGGGVAVSLKRGKISKGQISERGRDS